MRLCEPRLGVFKICSKSSEKSLESFKWRSNNLICFFRKITLPAVEWAVVRTCSWQDGSEGLLWSRQGGVSDGMIGSGSPGDGEEWSDSGLMIWMQSVGEREETKMTPRSLRN